MSFPNNFNKIFGSDYPIISTAMNQVSDLTLAKAVRLAGGLPSLSIYNYKNNLPALIDDLQTYKREFNDIKIFLSLGDRELLNPKVEKLILHFNIEFIELILEDNLEISAQVNNLVKNGIKIFTKCLSERDIIPNITGVILKGNTGAGRGTENLDLLFKKIKSKYPNLHIVVSGGIGTSSEVKKYIDQGAVAVGIGTLFAACKESKLSDETKLKMIESTYNDVKQFSKGVKQNALIFKEADDDYNHTNGLIQGISNPTIGHIFAGQSINQVTEIKSAELIIKELTEQL